MEATDHPQISDDPIIVDWHGGRPAGFISKAPQSDSWIVQYSNTRIACLVFSKHGGQEQAYQIALELRRRYSDDHSLTRNQIRWRLDKDGNRYGEVKLTRGKTMLFDAEDMDVVSGSCWFVNHTHPDMWYAKRSGDQKYYHNVVTGAFFIDHINRDSLDNRKANLRQSNPVENQRNRRKHKQNRSGVTGLSRVTRKRFHMPDTETNWVVHWGDHGKNFTRSFSCAKYGEELAKTLAVKKRTEIEQKLGITSEQ